MLVKASIAAAVMVWAGVSLSKVDFPQMYNEMYPVSGLQRDVLGLCHEAKPTFVRAFREDRVNCYDSMPDPIELAIGWVRTSSRLAALKTPTAIELAERLLAEAAMPGRAGLPGPRQFTGYTAAPAIIRPCEATALAALSGNPDLAPGASDPRLAQRVAHGDEAILAVLGLAPRGAAGNSARSRELPILPLGGASGSAGPENHLAPASAATDGAAGGGGAMPLLAPMLEVPVIGDPGALRAAAGGCRTPA